MSFEVLFSDTAREDFNQLESESPERIRIQYLLGAYRCRRRG
jgi:hypothetical protein